MNTAMATLPELAYNSNVLLNQYSLFQANRKLSYCSLDLSDLFDNSSYSRILIGFRL